MNLIPDFLPEALVSALGWTLLHSLWQGALLGLVLALLLVFLHRHSAQARYLFSGGALILQLLLSVATFSYYSSQPGTSINTRVAPQIILSASEVVVPAAEKATFWQEPLAVTQAYFGQHLPLLVTIWLLGILLMTLRFIGGVAYAQRLRHYKTSALGQNWQQLLKSLSQSIGVKQSIKLVESAMVRVPMTIGFAKPVILLPIGAVTGLSQAQVEAILAHELAHILRKDYLLNLVQSVVELLFFYHPAVWWMSGVVRAERENCCDDIAVAACGDTLTYARALAELEAMRLPAAPAMVMAFAGKEGSLLSRIKRLVGQQSLRPTFSEGFMAALVLVVGLTMLSAGAMAALKPSAKETIATKTTSHTIFTTGDNIAADDDEAAGAYTYTLQDSTGTPQQIVIIKNKKGKVTELYVNGKRIPNKDIEKYNALVEEQLQATRNAPRATSAEVEKNIAIAQREADRKRRSENYNSRYFGNDSIPPAPPTPPAPDAPARPRLPLPPLPPAAPLPPLPDDKEGEAAYRQEQKKYKADLKSYEKEMENYAARMRELHEKGLISEAQLKQQMERHEQMARRRTERHEQLTRQHEAMAKAHEARAKKMEDLRNELVKDGLLERKDQNLSFQLNDNGLYVNDKKQPKEMYEKYKRLMDADKDKSANINIRFQNN